MALLKYSCCAAYYTRFRPKPKCITVQFRTFLCVLLPYRNRATRWARHLDFCHSCRRCNAAASESVRRDRCPQRLQIYHVEETRDRITERCCSKIKRRHQLIGHNDSSCVGRPRLLSCNGHRFRPGTGHKRPTVRVASYGLVVVAAGDEAFLSGNGHGMMATGTRQRQLCNRWSRLGAAATAMMAPPPRARECSEATRFMAAPSLSAFCFLPAPLVCIRCRLVVISCAFTETQPGHSSVTTEPPTTAPCEFAQIVKQIEGLVCGHALFLYQLY